jgi:hypothetical protein
VPLVERDRLNGGDFDDDIERLPPLGRQVQEVGDVIVDAAVREPGPAPPDGGRRDVERGDVVATSSELLGVITDTAADDERSAFGGEAKRVQPGDDLRARGQGGPGQLAQVRADRPV